MLAWWYYLLKAWATQSPRDALDITRDMITGSGKWGDTKSSTMSGTYVDDVPSPSPRLRARAFGGTIDSRLMVIVCEQDQVKELAVPIAELGGREQHHQQR
jgi:hypothetical protein